MMRNLFAISALTLLSTTAHAAPPAWCSAQAQHPVDSSSDLSQLTSDNAHRAIPELVGALCNPDDEARAQAKAIEAARAAWTKQLQMTDADWADAAAWSAADQSDRNAPTLRLDTVGAWSALDPIDQYIAISTSNDPSYLADALGPHLAETGRLAYLEGCIADPTPVRWAMCQADVDAFDPAKVIAELHADTHHDGYQRFTIRLALAALPAALAKHRVDVRKVQGSDNAYVHMWDVARDATKQWQAFAKTHADLIALAGAMDDARITRSRKAAAGCDAKTWPAFEAAVAAIPATKFAHLTDEAGNPLIARTLAVVAADPAGYLAGIAHYSCHADAPDRLTEGLGEVLRRWPGFRGPRNAVETAVLGAGLQLDDRGAKLDLPTVDRDWLMRDPGNLKGGGRGVVASVTRKGDTTTIAFAKKMVPVEFCTASHDTGRITQIRSDGYLVYESVCTASITKLVNVAPAPQTVSTRYAGKLAAGMTIVTEGALVVAAYVGPQGSAPATVAGVPVH